MIVALGALNLQQHHRPVVGGVLAPSAVRALPVLLAPGRLSTAWWLSLAAVALTAALTRPVSTSEPRPWAVTSLLSHGAVPLLVGSVVANRRVLAQMWALSVEAAPC